MNIQTFISKLNDLVAEHDYHLWFGTKNSYNHKRTINDKTIILEPFEVRPTRTNKCYYITTISLWIGSRRNMGDELTDPSSGQVTSLLQTLINDATSILNSMNDSDFITITRKIENISMRYYETDSAPTTNNQAFLNINNLPVQIWI